jgi:uncharacterized protein with NRDE domain
MKKIRAKGHLYPPFNLVVFDGREIGYFCNSRISGDGQNSSCSRLLEKNVVYGLSNSVIDDPWVKVEKGKEKFAAIIRQSLVEHWDNATICEKIQSVMTDRTRVISKDLLPKTGTLSSSKL